MPARLTPFGAVYDPRKLSSPMRTPMRSPQVVAGPIDGQLRAPSGTESLRGEVQRVCVFRLGRFETEKQAHVEDDHQLVYALIIKQEIDDLRLWLCGIRDAQGSVCGVDHIVG